MPVRKFSAEEVLDLMVGVFVGGRGGAVNPGNPLIGLPTFGEPPGRPEYRHQERRWSRPTAKEAYSCA